MNLIVDPVAVVTEAASGICDGCCRALYRRRAIVYDAGMNAQGLTRFTHQRARTGN